MPLCTRAILPWQSRWGWAFSVVGRPCVAQRVWAIPRVACREGPCHFWSFNFASRDSILPADFILWISPPSSKATPAESYPRYSNLFSPSRRIGRASLWPTYPTIPHILEPPVSPSILRQLTKTLGEFKKKEYGIQSA